MNHLAINRTHHMLTLLAHHLYDMSPTELKVYLFLNYLCIERATVAISSHDLSVRANMRWKTVADDLESLKKRGLLNFDPQTDPFRNVVYELSSDYQTRSNKTNSVVKYENDQRIGDDPTRCVKDEKDKIDNRSEDATTIDTKNKKENEIQPLMRLQKSSLTSDELAVEIAREFRDENNIALYKSYCKTYPRNVILDAYERTRSLPDEKIKKNRGALFTYLVKKLSNNEI
jgi:hypothetical protein